MKALNEFRGINHVAIHIPDENGEPLCEAPRELGNDILGPFEIDVTPNHVDVCSDCRLSVPESEFWNSRYVHTDSKRGDSS